MGQITKLFPPSANPPAIHTFDSGFPEGRPVRMLRQRDCMDQASNDDVSQSTALPANNQRLFSPWLGVERLFLTYLD